MSVTATVDYPENEMVAAVAGQAVLTNFTSTTFADVSAALGIFVLSFEAPIITYVLVAAPSPPPPRLPSPPSPVLASEPTTMLSARLDSAGSTLLVEFDARPTNQGGMVDGLGSCSTVFDDATILLLQGTSTQAPQCRWSSETRLVATLNSQSQL